MWLHICCTRSFSYDLFCAFCCFSPFLCFFVYFVLRFIVNARFPRFWYMSPHAKSLPHNNSHAAACALIGSTHSGFGCWFPLFIWFAFAMCAVCICMWQSHLLCFRFAGFFIFFAPETLNAAQLLSCAWRSYEYRCCNGTQWDCSAANIWCFKVRVKSLLFWGDKVLIY